MWLPYPVHDVLLQYLSYKILFSCNLFSIRYFQTLISIPIDILTSLLVSAM